MGLSSKNLPEPTIEVIEAALPHRLHEVIAPHVAATPDIALTEHGARWSYRELDPPRSSSTSSRRA